MAHGVVVKNTSGHILISSEIESLHYAGKASFVSTEYTGLTTFPNYISSDPQNVLSGRCIHRYRIQTSYTPLFFIRPKDYSRFHSIINQWQSNGYWYVDVIQSGGTANKADVHVFIEPEGMVASGNYGIKTNLADGRVAFDSRLKPLAIAYANSVQPPADPTDGPGLPATSSGHPWNDTDLDHDFTCDDTYNSYYSSALSGTHTEMMFSAPALAQAVYSRTKYGYKKSCESFGWATTCQDHYSTATWWAMYHQGFKLRSGYVDAGWNVYVAGYYFWSYAEDGGWFGGGGGTSVTGNAPYNNKTINLSDNVIIVANASYYE